MRRRLPLLALTALAAALSVSEPAFAAVCPGTDLCRLTPCPAGAVRIVPVPRGAPNPIQRAIAAAGCKATFCVAPGTYTGNLDFLGKKINLVSSGGPAVTFLTAAPGTAVVTFKTGEGPGSILDGFTVQNGRARFGGGISITNASPVIRNCIVKGNSATGDPYSKGGGLFASGASAKPVVSCTRFVNNSAAYSGGGLSSYNSADLYVRSSHFESNVAPYGAGVSVGNSGRLDVGWTDFLKNQASSDGGGIHTGVVYGNVLVRQSWFKQNTAGGFGGAMWVPAGLADVANSTFDGNRAATGGAIASGYGGTASVWSSIFANNVTGSGGSSALDAVQSPYPSVVVNEYNLFFANTGGSFSGTTGDQGLLPSWDPLLNVCCPAAGSPALNAGSPGIHFNDADGSTNDIGACGGISFRQ